MSGSPMLVFSTQHFTHGFHTSVRYTIIHITLYTRVSTYDVLNFLVKYNFFTVSVIYVVVIIIKKHKIICVCVKNI